MKAKTTILLAALAAALVLITLATQRCQHRRESISSGPIFAKARWVDAAEIRIRAVGDSVVLRKQGEAWRVATEGDQPADTAAVRGILEKVRGFDRRYLRSRNPDEQKTFEVDDASATAVRFADAQGRVLADFRLGKNGPDYRSQYLRPAGSNDVYLIPEYLRSVFDLQRPTWRERAILAFDSKKVTRLAFYPEGAAPVALAKAADGAFHVAGPDSFPVRQSLIDSALRNLSTLRCDGYPDSLPSLADAGLMPPKRRVEIELEDGPRHVLALGNETKNAQVYASRDDDPTIFLINKGRAGSLVRDAAALKDTGPGTPPPGTAMPPGMTMPPGAPPR
jgi:hypothetical protein